MSDTRAVPTIAPTAEAPKAAPAAGRVLQRACACGRHSGNGGECAECRKKRLGLQRRSVGRGPDVAPPIVHDVLRSPGRPLDEGTRGFMESRFGQDFSQVPATAPRLAAAGLAVGPTDDPFERQAERQARRVMTAPAPAAHTGSPAGPDFSRVRVHTDSRAAESARAVDALAYTVGNHVVFDSGQYAPGTSNGRALLAHELTHVMQQEKQQAVQRFGGCLAPSEVPGIDSSESSAFGHVVEEIITADLCASGYPCGSNFIFLDDNNPAAYGYFLRLNNPAFTEQMLTDFYVLLASTGLNRIPDILVHLPQETAFYEIKPNSPSGIRAGEEKVGTLMAVYLTVGLPYFPGYVYTPRSPIWVAQYGSWLRVKLEISRIVPGLIVYRLCVDSNAELDLVLLTTLLAYVIRQLNNQRGTRTIRPVDLEPVFAPQQTQPPIADTNGALQRIAQFIEGILATGEDIAVAAERFLRANPDLIDYLLWAGVGMIVATLLETIATGFVGLVNDPVVIAFALQLIRVASALRGTTPVLP